VPALFAALCFAVGGWWVFRSLLTLIRGVRSRNWPVIRGEVASARVVRKIDGDDAEVWREELEYRYSIDGRHYRGTRRRFGVPARYDWNDQSTQPLRRGDSVDVIYNAARPSVSALHRGFSPFALIPLIAGAVLLWLGMSMLML
jgi:hypothetical protein